MSVPSENFRLHLSFNCISSGILNLGASFIDMQLVLHYKNSLAIRQGF
uniref:Uncharacterized protein n=1 Tax=Arundo donax TaxID=35708 RepID=A0A0A9DKZ0_ARUDO